VEDALRRRERGPSVLPVGAREGMRIGEYGHVEIILYIVSRFSS